MTNELLFIFHSIFIGTSAIAALALGKEALVTFVVIQCLLANFFVIKQISLFGFNATCSDVYTIGATIGLNLLQEYFGRSITKKTITINFCILLFYTIVSQLHLSYIPSTFDETQIHYSALLTIAPRILIASFSVFFFVQLLDYQIYGFLRYYFNNRFLLIRNYASIIICQGIDTILFSILGLYGVLDNLGEIIMVSYTIKLGSIVIATPIVLAARAVYKKTGSQKESF